MKHVVCGGVNGTPSNNRVALYFLALQSREGNKAIFLCREEALGSGIHYRITRVFCCSCYFPPPTIPGP